jgi:hypothetical protein
MFIRYSPKDHHVKTIPVVVKSGGEGIPLANNSVILRPGANELTEQEWAAIEPHVQDEIKQKIIVPFTVPVKKAGAVTKARTLKEVPVSVARKIIESCQNVADLKKWVRQELPDEIMLLVLKRLRKFKVDPDEFADDLPGEDTLDADITPEGGSGTEPEADSANPEAAEDPEDEETGAGENTETTGDDEDDEDPEDDEASKDEGGDTETTEDDEDPEDDDDEIPDFGTIDKGTE